MSVLLLLQFPGPLHQLEHLPAAPGALLLGSPGPAGTGHLPHPLPGGQAGQGAHSKGVLTQQVLQQGQKVVEAEKVVKVRLDNSK